VLSISNICVCMCICVCAHTHTGLQLNSGTLPGQDAEMISLCFTQRQSLYKHIQEVIIIVILFMEKCVAKMYENYCSPYTHFFIEETNHTVNYI